MIKKWIDKFKQKQEQEKFEGVYGYKAGCKLWGDN